MGQQSIVVRRIYDEPTGTAGYRVLVDRIWPRGLRKDEVEFNAWLKELAPSTALRRWYGHQVAKWPEFQRRYRDELATPAHQEELADLAKRAQQGQVTLLCGARDAAHSQAEVLREVLEELVQQGHKQPR